MCCAIVRMASNMAVMSGIAGGALLFTLLWKLLRSRQKISVQDKVVLITGASSGLGEACAHIFYKNGAHVILCARREKELNRVKADLLALKTEGRVHEPRVLALDLSELDSLPSKAQDALGLHGRVDILVNNGGISYRGEVVETKVDVDLRVMMVNYIGQVALTKALLPSMISQGYGHIITVSSVQGKLAIPFRSAYAASKHACQAFFDCLRSEVSHQNIKVSVASPGYIQTNLSTNAITGSGTKYGVMDATTASGMPPEEAAGRILRAVTHQIDDDLMAPLSAQLAVKLRNLFPSLVIWMMKLRAAKQRKQQQKSQ